MDIQLKPVRRLKISDQVFDQLKELIETGKFEPGTRLMPERDLSSALQVSRNAVREALNRLASMGLLDRRHGRGTFVPDRKTDPAMITTCVYCGKIHSPEGRWEARPVMFSNRSSMKISHGICPVCACRYFSDLI